MLRVFVRILTDAVVVAVVLFVAAGTVEWPRAWLLLAALLVVRMLSAILVWGGIGYLIDRLAGTGKVLTAIGMVVGAGAGTYLIYLRYGRGDDAKKP